MKKKVLYVGLDIHIVSGTTGIILYRWIMAHRFAISFIMQSDLVYSDIGYSH